MNKYIKSNKKYVNTLSFLILLIFIVYFKSSFSQLAAWREDESVTLWLALVNNLFDSPFGNVSSTGLPNPNLSVVISKFLTVFDSLSNVSFILGLSQMLLIYYAFSSNQYEYNKVLILFIGFNLYFTYLTTSIWYQFMITTLNALFLKVLFDYLFEKNIICFGTFLFGNTSSIFISRGTFKFNIVFLFFPCNNNL